MDNFLTDKVVSDTLFLVIYLYDYILQYVLYTN